MNSEIELKRYYAETSKGPHLSLNEDGILVDLESQKGTLWKQLKNIAFRTEDSESKGEDLPPPTAIAWYQRENRYASNI